MSWYLRLGAWIGIGTSPGALATGANIGSITTGSRTLIAVIAGACALSALAVATGLKARKHNAPAVTLAAVALGPYGPTAVAIFVVIGIICWTGFYVGVSSRAISGHTGAPGIVIAVMVGVIVLAIYLTGFRKWNVLVALTGIAATSVAVLTYIGVPTTSSAPTSSAEWEHIFLGAGFVVAYGAVFVVRAPDFTWDSTRDRDVWYAGATLAGSMAMFGGIGAAIYHRTGSWDFPTLVVATDYPAAAVALLFLSVLAPTVSGFHSGALGLRHLVGWDMKRGALAVTVVGTILGAANFDLALQPFLGLLGVLVPPVIATLLLSRRSDRVFHSWLAWAVGAGTSLVTWLAGAPVHVLVGISSAAAIILLFRISQRLRAG